MGLPQQEGAVIYLTGSGGRHIGKMLRPDFGVMLQQGGGNGPRPALATMPWAADNACYAKGASFVLDGYLGFLDRLRPYAATCLFATAPDVVADAGATWARSAPVLPLIRAAGFPAALVAQDGIDPAGVAWDAFDALFVGGTTAFKLSEAAYAVVAEAKRRGKWTHMGRVNSLRRLTAAAVGNYDSADGTFIAYAPDVHLPVVMSWLDALKAQGRLQWV